METYYNTPPNSYFKDNVICQCCNGTGRTPNEDATEGQIKEDFKAFTSKCEQCKGDGIIED